MRCHFRDGLVKGIVEAGVVCRRWEDRLRRGDKRQRLRDVERSKMRSGTQLIQNLRRDELVRAEFGPSVYNAMAYSHGRGVNMILDSSPKSGKGITLRLEDTFAQYQRLSVRGANV